jgi:hypothetical protein
MLLCAAPSAAPKAKAKAKPIPGLEMPTIGDLPKTDGLTGEKSEGNPNTKERAESNDAPATYAVTRLVHAQKFVEKEHPDQVGPVTRLTANSLPIEMPGFQTLVEVKSAQKIGAPIVVKLLDPKGAVVVSSEGVIAFAGHDTTHFIVEWSSFTVSLAGNYTCLVEVAGKKAGDAVLPLEIVK